MTSSTKLDKKNRKILYHLDMNARMPLTRLAKKVGLSPQTTKYRLSQLEKSGVIKGYVTFFDASRFGYLYYRLYIRLDNVTAEEEANIIDYFKHHNNVVWFISCVGKWDLEVLFAAKNFIHFSNTLKAIHTKFPGKLHNNITSVSVTNYHHPRAYLIGTKTAVQANYGGEPSKMALSKTDRKIIFLINQNARLNSSEIGNRLRLNYKTVQSRIKAMQKSGVIQAFRTWMDYKKIGITTHKVMFRLRKFSKSEERKALQFCKQHPNVVYFVTCVWPWDVEIEVESENEETFLNVLRSFRELMGDLITDYDTLTVTKEHKLNYCPFAEKLT